MAEGRVVTRGSTTGFNPQPVQSTPQQGMNQGLMALIQSLQGRAAQSRASREGDKDRALREKELKSRESEGAADRGSREKISTQDNDAAMARAELNAKTQLEATRMGQPDEQMRRQLEMWNNPIMQGMAQNVMGFVQQARNNWNEKQAKWNQTQQDKFEIANQKKQEVVNLITRGQSTLQAAMLAMIAEKEGKDISDLLSFVSERKNELARLDQAVRQGRNMSTGLGRDAASNFTEAVNRGGTKPAGVSAAKGAANPYPTDKLPTGFTPERSAFAGGSMFNPQVNAASGEEFDAEPTQTGPMVPGSIPPDKWRTYAMKFSEGALAGLDNQQQELINGLMHISATGTMPDAQAGYPDATTEAVQAWVKQRAPTANALASAEGFLSSFITSLDEIQTQQGAQITDQVKSADSTGEAVKKLNLRGVKIDDDFYRVVQGAARRTLGSIAQEVSPESIELEAARRLEDSMVYAFNNAAGDTKAATRDMVAANYILFATQMFRIKELMPELFDQQQYDRFVRDFQANAPETASYVMGVLNDQAALEAVGGYEGMARKAIGDIHERNPKLKAAMEAQREVGKDTASLAKIAKQLTATPGKSPDQVASDFETLADTVGASPFGAGPAMGTRAIIKQRIGEAKELIAGANQLETDLAMGREPSPIGSKFGSYLESMMKADREPDMRNVMNGAALNNAPDDIYQWGFPKLYSGKSPAAEALAKQPPVQQPQPQPQPAQPQPPNFDFSTMMGPPSQPQSPFNPMGGM